MALNITVQSYDQSLDFGLMADAAAMPEVRELAAALRVAFDDVRALSVDVHEDDSQATASQVARGAARNAGRVLKRAAGAAIEGAVDVLARPAGRMAQRALREAVSGTVVRAVLGTRARAPKGTARKRK